MDYVSRRSVDCDLIVVNCGDQCEETCRRVTVCSSSSSLTRMMCCKSSVEMSETRQQSATRQSGPRRAINGSFKPSMAGVIWFLVIISNVCLVRVHSLGTKCPDSKHVNSLLDTKGSADFFCDCSPDPSPSLIGWEINCQRRFTNSPPLAGSHEPSSDYYTLEASSLGFAIKYIQGKLIEVTCDESSPAFKPAMFQGFGVDEVDSFSFVNCPLPLLPLSIILHRTSIQSATYISSNGWPPSSSEGDAKNVTPVAPDQVSRDFVSQVKSLKIDSIAQVKVNASALRTLFNGLDSLERLRLINVHILAEPVEEEDDHNNNGNALFRLKRETLMANSSPEPSAATTTATTVTAFSFSSSSSPLPLPTTRASPVPVQLPGNLKPRSPNSASDNNANDGSSSSATDDGSASITSTGSRLATTTEMTPTSGNGSNGGSKPTKADESSDKSTTTMVIELSTGSPKKNSSSDMTGLVEPSSNGGATQAPQNATGSHSEPNEPASSKVDKMSPTESQSVQSRIRFGFSLVSFFPKLKSLLLEAVFPVASTADGLISNNESSHFLKELLHDLQQMENLELRKNFLPIVLDNTFSASSATLKRLYLIGNNIRDLESRSFANLTNLDILDLTNNQLSTLDSRLLSDLTSLGHLRLGQNLFTSFPDGLFAKNPSLKALGLNLNRNLTKLPDNFLSGLSGLQNFTLNDCNMQQLADNPQNFFGQAPALERIELRGNQLKNLTAHHFLGRNSRLFKVDLSYNNISTLSPNIFSPQSSAINELNLHGNELTQLEASSFEHLKNVRLLRLSFNNLTTIPESLLFNLRKLEVLDISRNQLVTVNPTGSRLPFGLGAPTIKKIDLSRNNMTNFEEFSSIDWSLYLHIIEINLSRNKFQGEAIIPLFTSTSSRVVLDLNFNQLSTINVNEVLMHESAVAQFGDDEEGGSAKIEHIPSQPTQVIVRLDHNPLQCDCNLEPFLQYANRTSNDLKAALSGLTNKVTFDFYSPNLRCSGPQQLAGRPLKTVDVAHLTCPITDNRTCPADCHCLYRSSDGHALMNCQDKGLKEIPEQLVTLSSYRNISLTPYIGSDSAARVTTIRPRVKGVLLNLSNNRISDVTPINRLIIEVSTMASEPRHSAITIELYLDNNTIKQLPRDFLHPEMMAGNNDFIKVVSLRNNLIQQLPVDFLKEFDTKPVSQMYNNRNDTKMAASGAIKLFLGQNPYNCTPARLSLPGIADDHDACQIMVFKSWLSSNYLVVGDLNEITCFNITSTEIDPKSPLLKVPDHVLCPQVVYSDQQALLNLSLICILLAILLLIMSIMYYRTSKLSLLSCTST
ncbi:Protein toll [Halotydeus destructor]|nr:Protein toll [Halotydeus destructor]